MSKKKCTWQFFLILLLCAVISGCAPNDAQVDEPPKTSEVEESDFLGEKSISFDGENRTVYCYTGKGVSSLAPVEFTAVFLCEKDENGEMTILDVDSEEDITVKATSDEVQVRKQAELAETAIQISGNDTATLKIKYAVMFEPDSSYTFITAETSFQCKFPEVD